ncbi:carbohydrate-binding protein [Flavobacterium fluviatile]|uniref:carbohydrate-binding protein n=1 Tax=Flavobacterium fluviatile TaxID=1862387 RepID=UPI0013D60007|nr:carbohydrate-binding protein [Flavobacterium fluviatile]
MKKCIQKGLTTPDFRKKTISSIALLLFAVCSVQAQFVHPGISHKKSDLDRMKYMVAAQVEPYYTSYQNMVADSKSSYNYVVLGKTTFTELGRDSGVNYSAWNSDIRAAYYNAIRWYITGDSRHADKAVEIFKAWSNLTSVTSSGTESLSGGVGYIMIEAAEIIKNTYSGWSTSDINKFKAMLVYPGYSTTTVPTGNATFYWKSYQGDAARHGNQGLSGWRTVMAMGIFLDNEVMYDRALRYVKGQTHRSDDLPYTSGPNTSTTLLATGDYADTYNFTKGTSIPDYGFNDVLTNYIYSNGQCQESSRDQDHVHFGLGLLGSMAEMAWNQGDDLYGHQSSRLLTGLEFNLKYNVSAIASYADQTTPWTPTNFIQGFERTGRWYSKAMSPVGRGGFTAKRPNWEMVTAHYAGRGFKTAAQTLWTQRARDKSIELSGYEKAGWTNDAIGWGGLTFRRPAGCYGDPISGFASNGLPIYAMNVLPGTIEAENYDYTPISAQGRTYNDVTTSNSGGKYRPADGVDIQTCSEGGYNVGWMADGEWLTYTVYIPSAATYNISIRYAASASGGKVKFMFGGADKTGEVAIPSTSGAQNWQTLVVKSAASLSKGVQSMKILISGTSNKFNINNIIISNATASTAKLAQTLAVDKEEATAIYPNPVSNVLTIANAQGASVQLSDSLGKLVVTQTIKTDAEIIDMSKMAAGFYFLKMDHNGTISTKKIIKE